MADPVDPTLWPCWRFHVTLAPVMVHTPEEEAALPAGYRNRPFSAEEQRDYVRAEREALAQTHKDEVEELEERLSQPVAAPKVKAAPRERWTPNPSRRRRK